MAERDIFDEERKQPVAHGAKAIEDAVKHSIQSRATDDSDVGLGGVGGIGGLLTYLFRAGELVAPWWSTQRDIDLRRFVKSSDHLSGTVSLLTSKVINVPVHVEPRDYSLKTHMKQADEYTRRLIEESEFGQGWATLCSKILDDWFCCDAGLAMEVIGDGPKDGPIQGPALGLAALDVSRTIRKKDAEFPITYLDEDGAQYKLHHTRVAYASDQPSNIVEMRGIGFCSVSRTINVGQNLVDMGIFDQEHLGSRPLRAILFTPGIPTDVVETTMQMSAEMMDNAGLRRFSKIPILGGNQTDADVRLIPLSSVPDGFDREVSTRLDMFAMALGFGVPIRWIWPAATSGATKADAMYQHIAGLGGGIGRILKVLTLILGGDPEGDRHTVGKFLPPHLKLVFDFQDDEQDRMKAEIQEKRMNTMAVALETGVVTLRVAREKALDAGDLTQAQFDQMELADGRLPSGEDVLTLFYAGDRAIRELLDLGVEDALDVGANDAVAMLSAIEEKQAEVRKLLSETSVASRKKAVKQALAALGKLREAYEEGQSAQQQADDAETEEQAQGEDQPKVEGDEQGSRVVDEEEGEEAEVIEDEKAFLDGVRVAWDAVKRAVKGGPGSGHHGHSGRTGKRGGSAPGSHGNVLIYHGTVSRLVDRITKEGIHIGGERVYQTSSVGERGRKVFATDNLEDAKRYAAAAAYRFDLYGDSTAVVFEIEVPQDIPLVPDPYSSRSFQFDEIIPPEWIKGYYVFDKPDPDNRVLTGEQYTALKNMAVDALYITFVVGGSDEEDTKVWSSLSDVPAHLRTMHDAPLTLAQVNHLARIGDAIERSGEAENPWAAARAQFQKLYRVENGQWVRRKKDRVKETIKKAVSDLGTLLDRLKGGPGSGHHGHGGRPGQRGGSTSGGLSAIGGFADRLPNVSAELGRVNILSDDEYEKRLSAGLFQGDVDASRGQFVSPKFAAVAERVHEESDGKFFPNGPPEPGIYLRESALGGDRENEFVFTGDVPNKVYIPLHEYSHAVGASTGADVSDAWRNAVKKDGNWTARRGPIESPNADHSIQEDFAVALSGYLLFPQEFRIHHPARAAFFDDLVGEAQKETVVDEVSGKIAVYPVWRTGKLLEIVAETYEEGNVPRNALVVDNGKIVAEQLVGVKSSIVEQLLSGIKSITCALKQTAGANRYRRDLRGAVQSLWDGTISGSDFLRVLKYQLIPLAFEQAWKDGAEAAGIEFDELTDAERKRLRERIVEERSFVKGFRDYIVKHDKAAGYKLSSLWPRTDLWVNRYMDVVSEARMMAGGDKKLKFQYFPEATHCSSCLKLNGQVRRASFWRDHDCRPQHPDLECMHSAGGPTVCKCEFEETDEPSSRGPLPSWRA